MGRPKGSRNLVSREVRAKFQQLVENQLETLEEDFKSLPARERIKYTLEMAKYILPQLKATEMEIVQSDSTPFDFNEAIARLRNEA